MKQTIAIPSISHQEKIILFYEIFPLLHQSAREQYLHYKGYTSQNKTCFQKQENIAIKVKIKCGLGSRSTISRNDKILIEKGLIRKVKPRKNEPCRVRVEPCLANLDPYRAPKWVKEKLKERQMKRDGIEVEPPKNDKKVVEKQPKKTPFFDTPKFTENQGLTSKSDTTSDTHKRIEDYPSDNINIHSCIDIVDVVHNSNLRPNAKSVFSVPEKQKEHRYPTLDPDRASYLKQNVFCISEEKFGMFVPFPKFVLVMAKDYCVWRMDQTKKNPRKYPLVTNAFGLFYDRCKRLAQELKSQQEKQPEKIMPMAPSPVLNQFVDANKMIGKPFEEDILAMRNELDRVLSKPVKTQASMAMDLSLLMGSAARGMRSRSSGES